ncbi:uncharacterized protein LOC143212726 isoform X2 [Lasioglossum baleicum]|uniref:uncharacterized protein LOC143212726 isoform X2 n=1 Tax=Lasioglossum baleicum TaxID=434251 RepID=UPI003FCC5F14
MLADNKTVEVKFLSSLCSKMFVGRQQGSESGLPVKVMFNAIWMGPWPRRNPISIKILGDRGCSCRISQVISHCTGTQTKNTPRKKSSVLWTFAKSGGLNKNDLKFEEKDIFMIKNAVEHHVLTRRDLIYDLLDKHSYWRQR